LKCLFEKIRADYFDFYSAPRKIHVTRKNPWPGCGSKDTKPAKERFFAIVGVSAKADRFTNKNST